jgi:hypothetical protein
MPTQYIIMFISAGIGFTFLVLGTLDWFNKISLSQIPFLDFAPESKWILDAILIFIGVMGTCTFLIYLKGTYLMSRNIRKLNRAIHKQSYMSDL